MCAQRTCACMCQGICTTACAVVGHHAAACVDIGMRVPRARQSTDTCLRDHRRAVQGVDLVRAGVLDGVQDNDVADLRQAVRKALWKGVCECVCVWGGGRALS